MSGLKHQQSVCQCIPIVQQESSPKIGLHASIKRRVTVLQNRIMHLPLTLSKQVGQYDWIVQQEKGKQDQIMTLDEVTMLLYLEGHQKMEDWSAPLDAFILYQLNSNNQLLRLLDVELPMRENALMMPSINKRSHANKKKK